ncbi:hypothetical protein B0H10DRAFT_1976872 [Mycena sp. CBHHK59/15]|nr:hypothetical protein B0H10DRAFT_1976872 [Mycena sp. CBHHK59/15]
MSDVCNGDPCKPKSPQSNALPADEAVTVFHPGYTLPIPMLTLVAFDVGSGTRGVPFVVVLDACRILANNLDGTLRKMGSDIDLAASNTRSLLKPGLYTYDVTTTGEARYPICTAFHAWAPPAVLPPSWAGCTMGATGDVPDSNLSNFSDVVKAIDRRCAVTGDTSRLESCHLIPAGEAPWWRYHNMGVKTNDFNGVNTPGNCLALRSDLNAAGMDQGHFVFAPYDDEAVCVCLTRKVADFAFDYHLRAVSLPDRIHPWNTYVRFAWGVFKASKNILHDFRRNPSKTVIVPEPIVLGKRKRGDEDEPDDEEDEQETNAHGGGKELGKAQDKVGKAGKAQGDKDEELLFSDVPLLSDDDDSPDESLEDAAVQHPLDLCSWTKHDLKAAELMDASLKGRPLTSYEEEAGMYPGYSDAMRRMYEYRKAHPEVSALRSARVARVGEDDYEP